MWVCVHVCNHLCVKMYFLIPFLDFPNCVYILKSVYHFIAIFDYPYTLNLKKINTLNRNKKQSAI